jgi:AcrR family transcriptional regulator
MEKSIQDQKKEQILESALIVMTNKGYFGSTMDDIVNESQMSKGAIYHYFKSKKEVYLAVIDYWEKKYSVILGQEVNEQKSSLSALKKLFQTFAIQLEKDPTPFQCLPTFWSISRHDEDFRKSMQKVYNRFQKLVEVIIIKGIENKEFKKINPKIASLSLILNIEGIFWFTLYDTKSVKASNYINTISDYILNAYTIDKE